MMEIIHFKKCPNETFRLNPPMQLQSTYIKDKFLAPAILYRYDASKAV